MANTDPYVFSTFKLVADIEGIGEVTEIVSMSGTFGLNSIPKASLVLACGINAITGTEAAAHKILKQIKMRAAVTVKLTVETTDGYEEKSPSQTLTIFKGYYAGFGFQRAQDNAQYTLHLVHWLDDLNAGSMLSRNFLPGAPYSLAQSANFQVVTEQQGSTSVVRAIPGLDPTGEYVRSGNYSGENGDLWGKVIKPIMSRVAGWPRPDESCKPKSEGARDVATEKIRAALDRMPGEGFGNTNPSKLPLNFTQLSGITPALLDSGVNAGLSKTGLEGFNYSTFWGALVGLWGPSFLFAVSPSAEFANVIPYFGGLRFLPQTTDNDTFKTIGADEYSYSNFMCNTGTILESIVMYAGTQSGTAIIPGSTVPITGWDFCKPFGQYPPMGARNHLGTIAVKEPPSWVTAICAPGAYTPSTTNLTGRYTGDVLGTPGSGLATPEGELIDRSETLKKLAESRIGDVFAEQWYKSEFLSQRYGELSGKLRFDIAPGSTVKIEPPRKAMPELKDSIDMIATVAQVSFVINAESATAGTAFSLTNIRSVEEDADPYITSPLPPMYSDKWAGGPLAVESDYHR